MPSKRSAQKAAEPQTAKKAKKDSAFEAIVEVIKTSDDLPKAVQNMLTQMTPFALSEPADKRTEFQKLCVGMIGTVFSSKQAALELHITQAKAEIDRIKESTKDTGDLVEEAYGVRKLAIETRDARQKAFDDAKVAVHDQMTRFREIEGAKGKMEAKIVDAESQKAEIQPILDGDCKVFQEGSLEPAEAKRRYKALQPRIKALGLKLDASLVGALPNACQKRDADRTPFDRIIVSELEKVFASRLSECEAVIAAAASQRKESEEKVAAALQALDTQNAAKAAAEEALNAAQAAFREKAQALTEAQSKHDTTDLEAAEKRHAQASNKLNEFVSKNLESFASFRDQQSENDATPEPESSAVKESAP